MSFACRITCALLCLVAFARSADEKPEAAAAPEKPTTWSQAPELLPTITPENPTPKLSPSNHPRAKFAEGPSPLWIWGDDPEVNYKVSKTFTTEAKSGSLFVSCDNSGTVFINDRKVVSNVPWDAPEVVDIGRHLKEGENTIVIEAVNEGSAAGLLCKLVLDAPTGSKQYLISDGSWHAVPISAEKTEPVPAKVLGNLGDGPWGDVIAGNQDAASLMRGMFHALSGFQVERLFTVPKDELGSWVAMTVDDQGRIIASDQGDKGLYRITPSPIGSQEPSIVEKIPVKLSAAQGLLCAFGSLYVSVNGGPGSGLYKVSDTNSDDQYDEVTKLAEFRGGGEHGPHALRLSPDGQSIYVVCGNHTLPPEKLDASRLPTNWKEDLLLPRMWDAGGHAVGIMAPGGWVAKTDPEGKTWELVSSGYRNSYDMDFNADGELFVYDADMEWDVGSPWYRPTRVNHATSGSELGWRSGSGKWPSYYIDSLPPLAEIGPGSPVGVEFGYGTRFPASYQKALYILDWTFGTIYAVHLEPDGSTYKSTVEEFVSRTPLPLTDCDVGKDGALYFTVGGRGAQSELFRVTYVGKESTDPVDARDERGVNERKLRHELEALHAKSSQPEKVIDFAFPHLGHEDRFIRYAARLAIEHQPVALWRDHVIWGPNPDAFLTACVALARQGEKSDQEMLVQALARAEFSALEERQKLDWLRAWQLTLARLGEPEPGLAQIAVDKLDPLYPAKGDDLNRELCNLLVYLKAPSVIEKTIQLIKTEPKAEARKWMTNLDRNAGYGGSVQAMLKNQPDMQKMAYVFALRNLKDGWTMDQRKEFFSFIDKARGWSGGNSYRGFLKNIDRESFEALSEKERLAIEAAGARKPDLPPELPKPKGPGKEWTFEEVVALGETELKQRDFKNGERTFAAAKCVICHRFGGEGGATGPDLTLVAGRFNLKDLTDATIHPNKVVSDQYKASVIETKEGLVHTGRIVSETEDSITILVNPEDATKIVTVAKSDIEMRKPSDTSIMPAKLLDTLNQEEVLDLLAYLLSRGDQNDQMFEKPRGRRRR